MNKPTSIYLDLIRFFAAATVFIVHANYDRFTGGLPVFWRMSNLGNDAVMVFFVLSGFVIAYVADQKEKTVQEYFISRFARLYSVALPGLVLTVVLDYFGSRVNYSVYNGWWFQTDNPVWRLLANFLFINELWFSSVRPFSNGPFWSLGYEFWYYVIFASAYYVQSPRKYFLIAAICLLIGPKILILFPTWVFGIIVYHIVKNYLPSPVTGWIMFIGSIFAYIAFRQAEYPLTLLEWTLNSLGKEFVYKQLAWSQNFLSSYIIGVFVAIHFVGAASVSIQLKKLLTPCESIIRYLANYTFAIYLFHFPCLQFFAAVSASIPDQRTRTIIVIGGSILVIWVLGTVTERRKCDLKRWLLSTYDAIKHNHRMQ